MNKLGRYYLAQKIKGAAQASHAFNLNNALESFRSKSHAQSQASASRPVLLEITPFRTQVTNILSKLQLENRIQAVLYALRQGIARLEDKGLTLRLTIQFIPTYTFAEEKLSRKRAFCTGKNLLFVWCAVPVLLLQ